MKISKLTIFKKKLSTLAFDAYSIVESISALLIVAISLGAGISIYGFVARNNIENDNTQLLIQMNTLLEVSKQKKIYQNEVLQDDNIKIERQVEPYNAYKTLLKVSIVAFNASNDEIQRISVVVNQ